MNQKNQESSAEDEPVKQSQASSNQQSEFAQQILQHVSRPNYQPVKPKTLARQLKIDKELFTDFRRTIKRMVKSGTLAWGARHMVTLRGETKKPAPGKPTSAESAAEKSTRERPVSEKPASKRKRNTDFDEDAPFLEKKKRTKDAKRGEIIGRFRRARQGFGFVSPDSAAHPDIKTDIHIPFRYTLDAADNDTVTVDLVKQKSADQSKGLLGRVITVEKRSKYKFVGTYVVEEGIGYVAIDNNAFERPVRVGDAGAKDCFPDDKVVIEMVRFPSVHTAGEGVIVEVLGARGKPGVDTLTIMREFDLPEAFPEKVIEDARKQAAKFDESISDGREDFTNEVVITIDPTEARDFDDAISLKRIEKGHWMLGVHIADVSHFVRPNTHLDNEAYERGTSVYLPDRVIPMLPETISNNLASLQPDRVRYVLTAWIEMTPDGARVHTEVHRGAIKSCRRFTYEEIDDFLANRDAWRDKLTPAVFQLLEEMYELAMILRKRRSDHGSIELVIPDVKVELGRDGKVVGAHNEEYTESHQIIEEFMLSANEAVAEKLALMELPYLRRIHEGPDPRKLRLLNEFVKELGIECESLESRFEIKRVLAEVRDRPERQAVNFSILRSMKKATYSPREVGHYALASENYCHFTSPIRRYPDLVIHRMISAIADGKRPAVEFSLMERIGDHCSQTEERAEKAERQLIKLKLLNFFADKIGTKLDGFVTGVDARGFYVQGSHLPVEGFVPLKALPRDIYDYYQSVHMIHGRRTDLSFRLGDTLDVVVAKVDLDQRELEFGLADDSQGKQRKVTRKVGGFEEGRQGGKSSASDSRNRKPKTFREKSKPTNAKKKAKKRKKKRK
jgi:ribonuclease R